MSNTVAQEIYCLKCKLKTAATHIEDYTMKNGRAALKGLCSVCNGKVFKILGTKK